MPSITELQLEQTRRRPHGQGITIDVTPGAVEWLANMGYQPEFGARPLRRTIRAQLDRKLSRMLLSGRGRSNRLPHQPAAQAAALARH